jgi:mannose-1-phosphate guanylyltransferase
MATISKSVMKAVIFAGGIGTRMWPISRTSTPKQFEKMVDMKSTLQLTVERLRPEFAWNNIYISSGKEYIKIIREQLPNIPLENIIGEPMMRDVAPAVGYALSIISKKDDNTPVAILWSDHILNDVAKFKKVLIAGGAYIKNNPDVFLFLGHSPRFANQNLGWIETGKAKGKINGFPIYTFKSWKYRPNLVLANNFLRSKRYYWNPGYWVVKPAFVLQQYKRFKPDMYQKFQKIMLAYGTNKFQKVLEEVYPTMEKISFDDAILESLEPEKAVVLTADFGWSDIGTWQALKEALQKNKQGNVIKGEVYIDKCCDNLIYNYNKKQLIVALDLKGLVVVNMDDILMICNQESMPRIKDTVNIFKHGKNRKYT